MKISHFKFLLGLRLLAFLPLFLLSVYDSAVVSIAKGVLGGGKLCELPGIRNPLPEENSSVQDFTEARDAKFPLGNIDDDFKIDKMAILLTGKVTL